MDLFDLFVKLGVDDSELESGLEKAGKAVKAAGAAMTAAFGAAGAGAVALVKESVGAYKSYEQLVGGVETLFSNLEGTVSAAPKVLERASNAFKTAGMSANTYMETVTSFSAALVSSLEGDYDKAADVADMAITDMADNANKMGTSLQSIQYAYQGFAKQNYTMLDNLKLGYGGTKEEMERLLKDAEKIQKSLGIERKYDLSNLGDVYEAIHVIQDQMGIAGTTAQEAADTIEGSFGQLGGAWENLIAGFANKDADLGKLIEDVVKSAEGAITHTLPIVEQAFNGMVTAIEDLVPVIADRLPGLVDQIVPMIVNAAATTVNALMDVLPDTLKVITNLVPDVIDDLVNTAADLLPQLVTLGADLINSLADGISDTLPDLTPVAIQAVLDFSNAVLDNLDKIIDAAFGIMVALADALTSEESISKLVETAPVIIFKLMTALISRIPKIVEVSAKIIKTMADNLVHVDWRETADKMMDNLIAALDQSIKQVAVWIDNATAFLTGQESKYGGDIANVPTSEFVSWMQAGKDDVVNAVGDVTEAIAEGYDAYYGTIEEGNEKASGIIDKSTSAYYNIPTVMSDYASSLEQQAAGWNKRVSVALDETEEDMEEVEKRLKAKFQEFETMMYKSGFSEEWLVHKEREYLEALDHSTELYKEYNLKLLKEEEKITKAADSAREKEVKRKFAEFERTALKEGYTEQWLLEQERNFIETLDHASELYEEYDLKLLHDEKKLNDELEKERKKDAENAQKAFEKTITNIVKSAQSKIKEYKQAITKIKDEIKSFSDNLTKSYADMFTFDVDEKTGKMAAKKTENYLHDATKQMETYYKNIQKLRGRGIDEGMLDELTKMDADKGAAVASYWASLSDKEFKNLEANWKKYEEASNKVSETLYADEMVEAEKKLNEERNSLLAEILSAIKDNMAGGGDLTINVAGQKAIQTTVMDLFKLWKNSGGVLDV